jgi:glycosyltransferase involved in cell wall biosynthesis
MPEVERYAKVVEQLARTETFDVVHAHDWMTYPAAIRAARASGKPFVAHVHACEYDRSGDHPNAAIVELERAGLAAADRVVCVSHFTAGIVRRRYGVDPAKLRVVHNAVTRREQREGWHVERPAGGPVVLFLGRVTFQKGPVYFLEAAARVVRVLPDVRFVMSGSGDMLPAMVERAAAMGLARHVRFTGFLAGADVERMFAMADLYVMPSVSEPFGISPLEAMAQDVPVIVSRQSGVAEVLASALKVDFWDVADLADKIVAVLRRPALRQMLASEGRREVDGMRWEARAELLRRLYDEVAA